MNNIIKKGIIFILVFIPTLICAQDKLYMNKYSHHNKSAERYCFIQRGTTITLTKGCRG